MKHTVSIDKLPNLLNRSRMEKTPLDILDERESVRRVKEIIDTLPEQQKSIIILRDIEQMEFEEIAEIMSMDMNLLRVTLSRARKKVREIYNTLYSYGLETYQKPS
jgi:RNA polymerase sigma-70 factor, ECF subfamily